MTKIRDKDRLYKKHKTLFIGSLTRNRSKIKGQRKVQCERM